MRARIAAVALAGCLGFAACEQLREDLPTAPTPAPVTTPDADRPTPPAPRDPIVSTRRLDPTTVHPLFEDSFWRELIFAQYDAPGTLDERVTLPFPSTSPNIYVWLADESGERVADQTWVNTVHETVPHLAEQLTGEPYRGRIEEGMADRSQSGWITVEFTTDDEFQDACGRGTVGTDPGRIWIGISERYRLLYLCSFREIFAHEFGHAMGLWHVNDPTALMAGAPASPRPAFFNSHEQYHAELLYRIGRGQRYCGWPFSSECAALNRGRSPAYAARGGLRGGTTANAVAAAGGGTAPAATVPKRTRLIDFGDDTSEYARDNECDDMRFDGPGMASELTLRNRGRDAARFEGGGMYELPSRRYRGHDATDCRRLYNAGRIRLFGVNIGGVR